MTVRALDNLAREKLRLVNEAHFRSRVTMPMKARIADTLRIVSEWNVDGFVIDYPLEGLKEGDVRTAHLELLVSEFHIGFEIPCQVTRATECGAEEFKFLGAFTEQARILHRIAEDHRAGHATKVDAVLCSPQLPRFGAAKRNLRLGLMVCSLGLSVALLATLLLASSFTVRSRVGAVSVEGTVLRAPATGVVVGDLHSVGGNVHEGQLLFRVLTPDMAIKVAQLGSDLTRLQLVSDLSRTRLKEINELTSNLKRLTGEKLESISAKIAAVDTQIAIYSKFIDTKRLLADRGFNSEVAVDEKRLELEGRKQVRQELQSDLAIAATQAELLKFGILYGEWRNTTESEDTTRLRAAEAEAAFATAKATLDAIDQAAQVFSPCDCLVYAVAVKAGEVVESGTPVLSLRVKHAAPVVEALFPPEEADGLALGSVASVSMLNGLATGRLEKLSYDDLQTNRVGLFPLVRTSTSSATDGPNFVRATISFHEGVDPSLIGAPAQVAIRTNPIRRALSRLHALVGSR